MVLWRPTRHSRTNTPKRCPFHYRGLECKSRKSRDTWSKGQIWLYKTNKVGQRLIEFCQESALIIQKPSSNSTREDSTHGHHQMVNTEIRLIMFFAAKYGEVLGSAKTGLEADCSSAQIGQQIWKTQQWPQDWKVSDCIPIPKKVSAKECSNYCTIALISHTSKIMLNSLWTRLQQFMNQQLPSV